MGNSAPQAAFQDITKRSEARLGNVAITGRYHRLPQTLEDDYVVETSVLGSGYNGQVYLARDKLKNEKFAVKGFKLGGVSKEQKAELEAEVEIFLAMDHPHVARLVDVYESEGELRLVMECMTGGELLKRVISRKRFSERDAADAAWQMLLAINYIHSHGIVHRDIKLENFLYESEDNSYLKLIDFGFSHIWPPNTKMAVSCGTLSYVAPEVLKKDYTSQCDMWSFGVTIFIVLAGYMPFSGSEALQMKLICKGSYTWKANVWKDVSEEAKQFVKSLLVIDPNKRLTAEAALHHPWIVQRDAIQRSDDLSSNIVSALTDFAQASQFRRACMSIMAWSLTAEERAKVREAFIEMDTDQTGSIKLGEFKQVLEKKFQVTDGEAQKIFESVDTNHDEEIHYSEFLAAMLSSRIAIHDGLLQQSFRRFDTDNSGFITAANLRAILGETFDKGEADKVMREADTDGDGKIAYAEWIAYLRASGGDDVRAEATARFIDHKLEQDGAAHKPSMRFKDGVPGGQEKRKSKQSDGCGRCSLS